MKVLNALCRQKLSAFAEKSFPIVNPGQLYEHNWHVDCIAEHLEACRSREIRKLIINLPPRFLKTYLVGVAFPAWCWATDPTEKFIYTSFSDELCKDTALNVKELIESDWYKSMSAQDVSVHNKQNEKTNFEIADHRGMFYAKTILGKITGKGADYVICDDPMKPDDSHSETQRYNVIRAIRGTLFSRFNDPNDGVFIMIMQRLHTEDPTGDLLEDGDFVHLKLPAKALQRIQIEVNNKNWEMDEGDLLFEDRFGDDVLQGKQRELTAQEYAGQYLQEPAPIGGADFKRDDLKYFSRTGFDVKRCNMHLTVDPASSRDKTKSKRNDNDYTAMVMWALAPDQNYYIVDGVRERLSLPERVERLFELHRKWSGQSGRPVKVGYENFGYDADITTIEQKMSLENYRFSIQEIRNRNDKRSKIRRLQLPFEQHRIYFPNDYFIKNDEGLPVNFMNDIIKNEILLFPHAPHDDFLDAMAMIFDMNPLFPKSSSDKMAVDEYDHLFSKQQSVWDV